MAPLCFREPKDEEGLPQEIEKRKPSFNTNKFLYTLNVSLFV